MKTDFSSLISDKIQICTSRASSKAKQIYIRSSAVKMFKIMRKKAILCKFCNSLFKYFILV